MLATNPWYVYICVAGPLIAVYYVATIIIFYRRDIKARWQAGRRGRIRASGQSGSPSLQHSRIEQAESRDLDTAGGSQAGSQQQLLESIWQTPQLLSQVGQLTGELIGLIEEAHRKDYGKRDLILLLQMTLSDYAAIEDTPFGGMVNRIIASECAKYGLVHLSEEDIREIWNQV
jgi:hypothetical protein